MLRLENPVRDAMFIAAKQSRAPNSKGVTCCGLHEFEVVTQLRVGSHFTPSEFANFMKALVYKHFSPYGDLLW